jgi:hypothetical protein
MDDTALSLMKKANAEYCKVFANLKILQWTIIFFCNLGMPEFCEVFTVHKILQ